MATTDLGKWMITNGGEYNPDTTYEQLTMVLYQNSTYITLRTVTGIIPNNDKINYILMAQGFSANALADVVAKDTYGVIGDVSGDVSAQNLVDYLTNEVVNNLLKKTSISTVQTNSDNTVPSSSLAYAMQQEITKNKEDIATANSNLEKYYTVSNTYVNFSLQQNVEVQITRRGILYGEFMSTSLGDFSFFKNDVAVFTSSVSDANVRIPFQPIHVEAGDRVRFTGVGITPTLTNMRLAQYTIQ